MNIVTQLSETLWLAQRGDGFWLWDDSRQMNLSVRAKTKEDAILEALRYYQDRYNKSEAKRRETDAALESFRSTIADINERHES